MLNKIKNIVKNEKFDSRKYWENRYQEGKTSGSGSYNHLAEFKAEVLNEFVNENNIKSVVEFGCGDGNQLKLVEYPKYIGLDVSVKAIQLCKDLFREDDTKSFFLYDYRAFVDNNSVFKSDLALSLDVLYHLVEKDVYESYLKHLFSSAGNYVIVYSTNQSIPAPNSHSHELHREFTKDIEVLCPDWKLKDVVKNKYAPENLLDEGGSLANFYIFSKI